MDDRLATPRLRLAVEVGLALILAVLGATTILSLTTPPDRPDMPLEIGSRVDLAILGRFDPFFRNGVEVTAAGGEALTWTLHGTRAGGGDAASAILAGPDGRHLAFRVGETLEPGATLTAVGTDHVQISRGGSLLRLEFPETSSSPPPVTSNVQGPTPVVVSEVPISAARFAAEAALTPRRQGDRIDGFVLQPRGRGDTLSAAGLRAGDVILSVNGMAMNAERVADLETELGASRSAEIEYERAGQRGRATLRIEPGENQ